MTYETLIYEEPQDGVGVVTLNRPQRANAMSRPMLRELDDLCVRLADNLRIRCVIVTGAGSVFCAGFDLKDQAEARPQGAAEWTQVLEADLKAIMTFWHLPKPTIAAVNGPALAGGFELLLACDLAVASAEAVFGEPELKFGAGIVAMLLPWFVGPKIAKGMIFTGEDKLSAAEALRLGLVNRVVPAGEVMSTAMELARRLARMDPMVLQQTKRAINRSYEIMGLQAALRAALEIDIAIEGQGSPIKQEFLEVVRKAGLAKALAWREARLDAPSG
jgi:enoyl-CoA hydratase